mmetsp:Transcript_27691/g.43229  ORF Transcript_27691/g.43229 Transcript_27691/m.43229 type:complete len:479 (-) Transcript_27691:207-1643(-)|eukprot:CAMPEP_0184326208 /NCGR_PEP_ID=MMETSP1049-20130417/142440_1 /TAXON_ID=77928 /ORGANISM="Proteomonas sulcata, Strain CCMP704" /LENGTH=478 /DNA_ID=CAMNT_0026648385 /DNA_START=804 /DNA_END=2240 /DNA_ORIENTATION=-
MERYWNEGMGAPGLMPELPQGVHPGHPVSHIYLPGAAERAGAPPGGVLGVQPPNSRMLGRRAPGERGIARAQEARAAAAAAASSMPAREGGAPPGHPAHGEHLAFEPPSNPHFVPSAPPNAVPVDGFPPGMPASAGLQFQEAGHGARVIRNGAGLPNGKRQRVAGELSAAAHQDALMELARENLLLKHQLHVASVQVNRLKELVDVYEQMKEQKQEAQKSQSRYWTEEEHQRFLEAIKSYGHKDVKAIASIVGTRSATQVRTHAQKYFMKLARARKQQDQVSLSGTMNPDQEPSENAEEQELNQSMETAAAAAAGESGTSAAAAAAFVAATNSKAHTGSKKAKVPVKATVPIGDFKGTKNPANGRVNGNRKGPNPGSPESGSSGSMGCSDSTSNGNGSNGVRSSDTTNGNGSIGSSNGNGHSNSNGSSSDSGRCGDSNNGVSSNEGSDHGFFDTGAEEEDNFPDELDGGETRAFVLAE